MMDQPDFQAKPQGWLSFVEVMTELGVSKPIFKRTWDALIAQAATLQPDACGIYHLERNGAALQMVYAKNRSHKTWYVAPENFPQIFADVRNPRKARVWLAAADMAICLGLDQHTIFHSSFMQSLIQKAGTTPPDSDHICRVMHDGKSYEMAYFYHGWHLTPEGFEQAKAFLPQPKTKPPEYSPASTWINEQGQKVKGPPSAAQRDERDLRDHPRTYLSEHEVAARIRHTMLPTHQKLWQELSECHQGFIHLDGSIDIQKDDRTFRFTSRDAHPSGYTRVMDASCLDAYRSFVETLHAENDHTSLGIQLRHTISASR